jgi:hypothetical protein
MEAIGEGGRGGCLDRLFRNPHSAIRNPLLLSLSKKGVKIYAKA